MNELEKTGYCWSCGRPIKEPVFLETEFDGYLFCNKKCEKSYKAKEQRITTKDHGKRANYGVKGV